MDNPNPIQRHPVVGLAQSVAQNSDSLIEKMEAVITQQDDDISRLSQACLRLKDKIATKDDLIAQQEKQLKKSAEIATGQETTIRTLTDRAQKLTDFLDQEKEATAKQKEALQQTISVLTQENEKFLQEKRAAQQQIAEQAAKIDLLQKQLQQISASDNNPPLVQDTSSQEIAGPQISSISHRDPLGTLELTRRTLAATETTLNAYATEIKALNQEAEELDAVNTELLKTNRAFQQQVQSQRSLLEQQQETITEQAAKIDLLQKQVQQISASDNNPPLVQDAPLQEIAGPVSRRVEQTAKNIIDLKNSTIDQQDQDIAKLVGACRKLKEETLRQNETIQQKQQEIEQLQAKQKTQSDCNTAFMSFLTHMGEELKSQIASASGSQIEALKALQSQVEEFHLRMTDLAVATLLNQCDMSSRSFSSDMEFHRPLSPVSKFEPSPQQDLPVKPMPAAIHPKPDPKYRNPVVIEAAKAVEVYKTQVELLDKENEELTQKASALQKRVDQQDAEARSQTQTIADLRSEIARLKEEALLTHTTERDEQDEIHRLFLDAQLDQRTISQRMHLRHGAPSEQKTSGY